MAASKKRKKTPSKAAKPARKKAAPKTTKPTKPKTRRAATARSEADPNLVYSDIRRTLHGAILRSLR